MLKHNVKNERIKRDYLCFLREAKRQSPDSAAASLARFESHTRFRDFKKFHKDQAGAFKRHLATQNSQSSGEKLSKSTQYTTLSHLKRFFQWLAWQPGYKSSLNVGDAEYFNLSEKETRVATARRQRPVPTLEQIRHVLSSMPSQTDIEKRDRALVAFVILTGARDSAVASLMLKHVDLAANSVYQDARVVQTKFSKTFTTMFFPVGDNIRKIVADWVLFLREDRLWGNDGPLFPKTRISVGENKLFTANGLDPQPWSNATPIRQIFRKAFEAAGLPYFNPHSFRSTLVTLGEKMCRTPEEFKAWSQNLGHEGVLTTFYSYGEVSAHRQSDIMRNIGNSEIEPELTQNVINAVMRKLSGDIAKSA